MLLLQYLQTSSQTIESQRATCSSHTSCSQCINSGYFCGWCTLSSINSTRCIPLSDSSSCAGDSLNTSSSLNFQYPRSSIEILEDAPLGSSRGDQIILTRPQRLKLELRLGETRSFNLTSSPAPGYPLDLYLLMDLSYSMKEGFMQIQSVSQQLVDTVRNITSDYRLGMGSFVDKPIAPFR